MESTPIPKTALKSLSVKTTLPTLPYPPLSSRPVIKTARLLIRPFSATDLDALHALRTQPEVMAWMPLGQIDPDVTKTQAVLEKKLLHDDQNYSYAICLASSGALIGTGGCHSRGGGMLGWPEIGYMLRREAWGMGYGTEFLAGFLEAWWTLPRGEAALTVDVSTLDDDGGAVGCDGQFVARECISSFTREDNRASRRVMCKAGMSLVKVWEVIDMRDGKTPIDLYGYVVRRPGPC